MVYDSFPRSEQIVTMRLGMAFQLWRLLGNVLLITSRAHRLPAH